MLVEKKRRKIVKNPIRQIGTDIQMSPTGIVISIANALGLKIRYDKDEDGKVIGVSVYGGRCLRLADHCTYMQTWVDAGTWNSPYRYDIVICDNPSEQQAKTQVQSGYDFTISEFIYGTEDMTVEKARMIAYDIKQAINVGQYANNVRGEKRILTSTHDADDNQQSTQVATKQNITKNKQDTNMKTENRKRNVVRLTESQLKQIVAESVKKVLKEWNSDDDFICHGCKAWSNWGGIEMQISDGGDEARLRYPDGEITDWLEIEYDEEGVAYITAPNGEIERFDEYERVR